MVNAVSNIERKHFHHLGHHEVDAHWAINRDGVRFWRHDPASGDDVIEISQVIAMKMRHKNGREGSGTSKCCSEAHHDTTPRIAQNDLIAGAHKR
ncbi:unannotated protein [freshwater metagenome]|uniref:Unannotated protein n=1 Tax=freshwater metagenome TaxID=449393 RepID=A0A6J6ARE8_9ZZZZ